MLILAPRAGGDGADESIVDDQMCDVVTAAAFGLAVVVKRRS